MLTQCPPDYIDFADAEMAVLGLWNTENLDLSHFPVTNPLPAAYAKFRDQVVKRLNDLVTNDRYYTFEFRHGRSACFKMWGRRAQEIYRVMQSGHQLSDDPIKYVWVLTPEELDAFNAP